MALTAVWFKPDQSRFEINRLAEHNRKYKILAQFLDIYPGLRTVIHLVALIVMILLTSIAVINWGFLAGGAIAFGTILLAILVGRALRHATANIIGNNLELINHYFSWAIIFGKLAIVGDEPQITSEQELLHIIDSGDFMSEPDKTLLKNALGFRDKTAKSVMTARDKITFVRSSDHLTPKLLNDLFESGHKVFPVVKGDLDHIAGYLYLDDVLPIQQDEKTLAQVIRKNVPPVDIDAPLEAVLRQMSEYHISVLLAEKDGKTMGLLSLADILRELF